MTPNNSAPRRGSGEQCDAPRTAATNDHPIGDKPLHFNKAITDEAAWKGLVSSTDSCLNSAQSIQFSERFFGLGVAGYNNDATSKKWIEKLLQRCLMGSSEDDVPLEMLQEIVVKATLRSGLGVSIFQSSPSINTSLKVLRLQSGFVFQHTRDVSIMASAIRDHPCLQEFTLRNFSMNCQDVHQRSRRAIAQPQSVEKAQAAAEAPCCILDPLVLSAATIPTLEMLDLTCMMAHRPRITTQPFVSPEALQTFLESNTKLTKLSLSKLGLGDAHLRVLHAAVVCIAFAKTREEESHSSSSSSSLLLEELVWDDNTFSEAAWEDYLLPVLANPTLRSLKAYSQARLSKDSCEALLDTLGRFKLPSNLQTVNVNLPWEYREPMEFSIAMNRLGRMPPVSTVDDATPSTNSMTADRNLLEGVDVVKDNLSAVFTLIRQTPLVCRHVQLCHTSSRRTGIERRDAPVPPGFVTIKKSTPKMSNSRKCHSRRNKNNGEHQSAPRSVSNSSSHRSSSGGLPAPTDTSHLTRSNHQLDLTSKAAKLLQTPWPEPKMKAENILTSTHISPSGVDEELAAAMKGASMGTVDVISLPPPPEPGSDSYSSDLDDSSVPAISSVMTEAKKIRSDRKKKRLERRRVLGLLRSKITSIGNHNRSNSDITGHHGRWLEGPHDDNVVVDYDDDSSAISEHVAIERRNELLAKERSKRRARRSASSSPAVNMRKQRAGEERALS